MLNPIRSKFSNRSLAASIRSGIIMTFVSVVFAGQANAQVTIYSWSGNGNSNDWSAGDNWVDGTAPTDGNQSAVVFADSTVRATANQNIFDPMTLQSMFLQSSTGDVFDITGGALRFDSGTFEIDGANESDAKMSNNLTFANDAEMVISSNARFLYSGTSIDQEGQTGGLVNVSGNGELAFTDGSIPTLSAHLNISTGVLTTFNTGSVAVSITDGFDTNGDVRLGFTTLDFLAGGTINGNVECQAGTIRNSLSINGTTTVTNEASFTVDNDATINGTGRVEAFEFGQVFLENNAFINQDVAVFSGGFLTGTSTTSTITGTTFLEGGAVEGTLQLNDNLIADGNARSFIIDNAFVNVSGLTDVVSGVLEIGDDALLYGDGLARVQTGAAIDLQFGTIEKNVLVQQGGFLNGNGSIIGNLQIDGVIEPGNSAGTLEVDGDVSMSDTTVTCVEIGGSDPGAFDLITSPRELNIANLDGILVVNFLDDYVPTEFDEFSFIQGFMINGTFDNTGPAINFNPGGTSLLSSTGTLNTNLGVFQVEYGTDYVRLYGFSAVPEPGSLSMLALFAFGVAFNRRRVA